MIPASEKDWYRPPNFIRIGWRGDCQCFVWVAEPTKGEGVYGVSYRVSESLAFATFDLDALHQKMQKWAKEELYRRIERGEKHPEGSLFETMMWNPILIRDREGNISIEGNHDL